MPCPSEAWSPKVSEAWSPPVAEEPVASMPSSPTIEVAEASGPLFEGPAVSWADELEMADEPAAVGEPPSVSAGTELFSPPAREDGGLANTSPRYVGCPPRNAWQVQSHFLPSLGRFGLKAPRTPGVDSVHSPYLLGPAPWGPPVQACAPSGWDQVSAEQPAASETAGSPSLDPSHPADTEAHGHPPCVDPRAELAPYSSIDFQPDPFYDHLPYDACAEQGVYGEKHLNPVQRPLVEWGVPLYESGPMPPPSTDCGQTNPSLPRFYLYGDYRAAAAYNAQNGSDVGVLANRLNLEWDLWLTSTERFHMFTGPLQRGNDFTRVEFNDGRGEFIDEFDFFDADTDTLFFEGDLGYMIGGWRGHYASFDLPVTVGLIPLLFQNGVWLEDAMLGAAVTIPARNSPSLDWSNFDVTFFAAVDQVTSPAFAGSNAAANVFGTTTMIEAKGGYIEAGYAFLDDTTPLGRGYHNIGLSYTRRYLNLVSNSMRLILNTGQDGPQAARTADGVLVIAENSFLTPWPYNVIPYVNLFAGFDDPQSVARAGAAGGVLRNTGILFESDNLTGYPTLDATGNDTYGAAIGLDLLAPDFSQQLILEAAVLQVFGDPAARNAAGDQYGLGLRYQVPITNAHLLRFDVMHGWLGETDDVTGARAEFRWKF